MPRKPELESALELRCVAKVEALGGLALKLVIPGVRGFPDRSVMLPGYTELPPEIGPENWYKIKPARLFFVEFKRLQTGRVSAQQVHWKRVLEALGFAVYLIDTDEQFDAVLEKFL